MPVILRIAVPGNPLRRYFDYLPPADLDPAAAAALAPGCRLRVPFGRRSVVAFLASERPGCFAAWRMAQLFRWRLTESCCCEI